MKRKYLAIIYLLLLSIGTILSLYMPKNEVIANDTVVIPSDAIRLRILANSDSTEDQALKRLVRDEVNQEITKWVAELTSKEEAREVIQAGLPEIEKIAEQVMVEQNSDQEVNVEFGQVDFPTKLYGEFLYPAGKYEAILITLGDGVGANWWCVLFPPLCFLDFSNGVAVSEGFDENAGAAKVKAEEIDEDSKGTVEMDDMKKEESATKKETDKELVKEESAKNDTDKEEHVKETAAESDEVKEDSAGKAPEEKSAKLNEKTAEDEIEEEQKSEVGEVQKKKAEQEEPAATEKGNAEIEQEPVFAAEQDEIEVKFFIKEVWDKIFG